MDRRFSLTHIDISTRQIRRDYQASRENIGGGAAPRIREEHGARLAAQLEMAFQGADNSRSQDVRLAPPEGVYLEVELRRKAKSDELEKKKSGIKPGAVHLEENETLTVALYVPDEARQVLEKILEDYRSGPLTKTQKPPNKDTVEPIEAFRQARLETFWTDDPVALPSEPHDVIWWELWCFPGAERNVLDAAERLGARAADEDNRLRFPEMTVIPVLSRISRADPHVSI